MLGIKYKVWGLMGCRQKSVMLCGIFVVLIVSCSRNVNVLNQTSNYYRVGSDISFHQSNRVYQYVRCDVKLVGRKRWVGNIL